ncbi:hypothetical protein [Thalassoglobus sp.]|uniref:hypothetical protein n=1 Tax=Thalassoglobus sp. TaxID=2795869 RepID=UPI003AA89E29
MSTASKAFAESRREQLFRTAPSSQPVRSLPDSKPWHQIKSGEMPPLMFQLRFRTGEVISYTYSDLREIRFRDAGFVQLGIMGMSRVQVTIQGRHLRELAESLGNGLIRWIAEIDERDVDRPESSPSITGISIEQVQGD